MKLENLKIEMAEQVIQETWRRFQILLTVTGLVKC